MEQRSTQHQLDKQKKNDWFLRFIKGMFIGSGFILPGVSGGALAAIFGLYERMIAFLANVTKDFKKNFLFFLPVGIGALAGIVVLSFGVSFLLGNFETIILWFFIGCIVGTIPALWKEAGKEGRSTRDILILLASFIVQTNVRWFQNIRHERDPSNRIRRTCNISALLKTCTLHFQESLPTIIPLHFRNRACFNCNDHPNKLRWI